QMLLGQFIEIRMADVMSGQAATLVPRFFERQSAQDVIDPAAHLVHAPAAPTPKLRWNEIEDRDAVEMGTPGQPPVEARVINEEVHRHPCLLTRSSPTR